MKKQTAIDGICHCERPHKLGIIGTRYKGVFYENKCKNCRGLVKKWR